MSARGASSRTRRPRSRWWKSPFGVGGRRTAARRSPTNASAASCRVPLDPKWQIRGGAPPDVVDSGTSRLTVVSEPVLGRRGSPPTGSPASDRHGVAATESETPRSGRAHLQCHPRDRHRPTSVSARENRSTPMTDEDAASTVDVVIVAFNSAARLRALLPTVVGANGIGIGRRGRSRLGRLGEHRRGGGCGVDPRRVRTRDSAPGRTTVDG